MVRPGPFHNPLAELLTLWAALVGLVAVAAILLFSEVPKQPSSLQWALMFGGLSLGCLALASSARLFMRRWSRVTLQNSDFAISRHAASLAFALSPALLCAGCFLPSWLGADARAFSLAGCFVYGLGTCLVIWHGAHGRAPVIIRLFYWAALPLVGAFMVLMGCVGRLSLLL